MQRTADRGRPAAIALLLLVAVLFIPARAQSVNYTGWEWEGRTVEFSQAAEVELVSHPDEWLARDKAMHAGASFLITLSSQYVFESKLEFSEGEALSLAMSSALSAGLLKEVLDRQRLSDPHFCYRDLVADAVGVLLAAGLVLL